MADEDRRGSYASTLADKKSKRLESALSSYSPDETKKAVGRLLEAYMDEGGKNYFGAGRRDTTLYFADDEYIKEIDKEKGSKGIFKGGKKNVHNADTNAKAEKEPEVSEQSTEAPSTVKPVEPTVSEPTIIMDEAARKQIRATEADNGTENADSQVALKEEPTDDKEETANENGDKSTEEEIPEMKHNGEYDDVEEEAVPRRRRSHSADVSEQKPKKKPAPPVEEEEDDDYDDFDEDLDDDYEYDEDDEKGGLFSIFRKKRSDEEYDEDEDYDEEYDDEEYDDEDEYDDFDDDEYEESALSVKKIFHVILVVILICAVAALAAMCYSYKNNYDSAKKQIEDQLQSSEDGKSPAEQINELKAQVEQLKEENEKLKSGTAGASAADTTGAGSSENTPGSGSGDTTADGAPSSVVDDTSGATGANSGSTYVVQAGDNTGVKLCRNIYGEYTPELWQKLCEANGKSGTDFVVGEEIIVP